MTIKIGFSFLDHFEKSYYISSLRSKDEKKERKEVLKRARASF
jgi:hypothetical protein